MLGSQWGFNGVLTNMWPSGASEVKTVWCYINLIMMIIIINIIITIIKRKLIPGQTELHLWWTCSPQGDSPTVHMHTEAVHHHQEVLLGSSIFTSLNTKTSWFHPVGKLGAVAKLLTNPLMPVRYLWQDTWWRWSFRILCDPKQNYI